MLSHFVTVVLLGSAAAEAPTLEDCKTAAAELNNQFFASPGCAKAPTPSWHCSGIFLTVRTTTAPPIGDKTRCPTTKELIASGITNYSNTGLAQAGPQNALWCPCQYGVLDDMRDGHISASFMRSDLPFRKMWMSGDGVGMIYDTAMLVSSEVQTNQSLLLSLFPNDGGTANKSGCGALAQVHDSPFPHRGCFAKNATEDGTIYTKISDIAASWPKNFTDVVRAHTCTSREQFDHSPTCVVAANEFDSIFIPESQKPPPYQPGNLPECNMYNEVAIQTTAGLPHSQQPLRAFFYKVADPTPGHCCGRNQTTWPTCPDAQEIYIQKLHQQASLFSTVSGGKAAPVVGINMTNSSWKTGPFFCDASYYA